MSEPDGDPDDSVSPEEQRSRRCLNRHRILFMLGFGPSVIAMWIRSPLIAAALFSLTALSWGASGVYAIVGRRHMFGGAGVPAWGVVRVRASGPSPIVARIVGLILLVVAAGVVNVVVQLVRL